MEESSESYFDGETLSLVGRFETMHRENLHFFFDVDEFEDIIDYYFFKNDNRKALICIHLGLEQHPSNPVLMIKLAQYYINSHKDQQAIKTLRELDLASVSDSDIFLAKGNLYSQLEKPEKAIAEFLRALEGCEFPDEVYANIAFEYENLGKYHKAIDYLLKALELNPDNDALLYEFSFCCEISGQSSRSIRYFQSYLDKYPYSAPGWFNLGIAFSNCELYEKAIEAYEYVLAIDDSFSSAHFNKANCQANLGNFRQAIETYLETFQYEDPEATTYYYIGECHEKLLEFGRAMEYYQKSVDLDPEFSDGWLGLGICHDELGHTGKALPFVEKAIKLSPGIPEYWFIQGDILIKLDRTEEGVASYRKVIELNPEDPEIWLDLSIVYSDARNFQTALDVLTEGLSYHDDNPDFCFGIGYYLYMLGRSNQGSEMILRGITLDPEAHKRLFSTFPEACNHPEIVNLIAMNIHSGFPGIQ